MGFRVAFRLAKAGRAGKPGRTDGVGKGRDVPPTVGHEGGCKGIKGLAGRGKGLLRIKGDGQSTGHITSQAKTAAPKAGPCCLKCLSAPQGKVAGHGEIGAG